MKKEEIDKYCKKYSNLYEYVVRESAHFDLDNILASDLFKKVEKFKKKHKVKDVNIEVDTEYEQLELHYKRKRTQKELVAVIKELKEQEEFAEKEKEKYKKKAVDQELRTYKKLHKKYGKK